ncbi:MAG: D-alanine--D-alanine ligase [Candidatus Niyogibacteria bacterium]|nr:D-alanine--D-alanine ligase [Candidatus Niyogibacteria bacterium]
MNKITVGVLRGGPSSEYEISLRTGQNVLKHLARDKYRPLDILLTKKGEWHVNGIIATPDKIFRAIDVIFNALHGEFGEDGKVQRLFEIYNIPYTGSASWTSFLAMNKIMARESFKNAGLKIVEAKAVKQEDNLDKAIFSVVRKMAPPWVIKPVSRGSSIGISIAKNIEELPNSLKKSFQCDETALVEKYIKGREATCAVLENFRGENLYAFPAVEIVPPETSRFFDYAAKYGGAAQEICPGRFSVKQKQEIQEMARKAHQILGCRHYSRSDFIVARDGVYILETNTLPGLTAESLFPKAAGSIGLEFPKLLDHLIQLAHIRK